MNIWPSIAPSGPQGFKRPVHISNMKYAAKTWLRRLKFSFLGGEDISKTESYVSEWFKSKYNKNLKFFYASFPQHLRSSRIAHFKASIEGMKYPIFIESSYAGKVFFWDWLLPKTPINLKDVKL